MTRYMTRSINHLIRLKFCDFWNLPQVIAGRHLVEASLDWSITAIPSTFLDTSTTYIHSRPRTIIIREVRREIMRNNTNPVHQFDMTENDWHRTERHELGAFAPKFTVLSIWRDREKRANMAADRPTNFAGGRDRQSRLIRRDGDPSIFHSMLFDYFDVSRPSRVSKITLATIIGTSSRRAGGNY